MANRDKRKHYPPKAKEEKVNKVKRENQQLRTLASRQRRDLKNLRAILVNVKRALADDNLLRAVALIPEKIKHPPSEVIDCNHEWTHKYTDVCKHCGVTFHG